MPTDPLLKPADVATQLGVSEPTVRRYVKDKALGCIFIGRTKSGGRAKRRMRFQQRHVDAFLKLRSGR